MHMHCASFVRSMDMMMQAPSMTCLRQGLAADPRLAETLKEATLGWRVI